MANPILKMFMAAHVGLYRLFNGKGVGSMGGGKILLLTTTGNKTGKKRTVPVMYFEKDGRRWVVASFNGAPVHPAWFKNLQKTPSVSVQVGAEKYEARAEVVSAEDRPAMWAHTVATMKRFDGYEKKVAGAREIPVVELKRT